MGSKFNHFRHIILDFEFFYFQSFSFFHLSFLTTIKRRLLWSSSVEQLLFLKKQRNSSVYCEDPFWKEEREKLCATPLIEDHWIFKRNVIKSFDTSSLQCITRQSVLSFLSTDFLLSIAVVHFHHMRAHNRHFHIYCVHSFSPFFSAMPAKKTMHNDNKCHSIWSMHCIYSVYCHALCMYSGDKDTSFICFYCCLEIVRAAIVSTLL